MNELPQAELSRYYKAGQKETKPKLINQDILNRQKNMATKYCKNCGVKIDAKTKFCKHCGTETSEQASHKKNNKDLISLTDTELIIHWLRHGRNENRSYQVLKKEIEKGLFIEQENLDKEISRWANVK